MKLYNQIETRVLYILLMGVVLCFGACKTTNESLLDEKEVIEHKEIEEIIDDGISTETDHVPAPTKSNPPVMSLAADGAHAVRMSSMSKSAAPRSTASQQELNLEPGQITAAEWNDLHNWKDWLDLQQNKDYEEMQDYWGIYPQNRVSVFLRNQDESPIQFAKISCLYKNETLWTAYTDNSGKAELWPSLFDVSEISNSDITLNVEHQGREWKFKNVKTIADGVNSIVIDAECESTKDVDIMWVVDATGSMSDEIRYLQSELGDVIERFSKNNKQLNLRTGAVFYRDHQDEYLTKTSDLSNDHDETLSFIGEQSAAGGGDYPEAVESAMQEALDQEWRTDRATKILFLLLDAPPHQDSLTQLKIQEQIRSASEKGIKLIPITASGINRETEFLMKYMAIVSNGTYVFITDHSGIGNAHLEPVVEDYKVEKLNELLLRLIENYTQSEPCEQTIVKLSTELKIYPNPTSNFVTIESKMPMNRVEVISNSGKLLLSHDVSEESIKKIDLTSLVDGMYVIVSSGVGFRETRTIIKVTG